MTPLQMLFSSHLIKVKLNIASLLNVLCTHEHVFAPLKPRYTTLIEEVIRLDFIPDGLHHTQIERSKIY